MNAIREIAATIAAAAVMLTAACGIGGSTTEAGSPQSTATATAPAGAGTPSATICSPLPLPTHGEVEAAMTARLQAPDYDGGPVYRERQVEVLSFSYDWCENRAASLVVTYRYTDPANAAGSVNEVTGEQPLTLTYCNGKWEREEASACP